MNIDHTADFATWWSQTFPGTQCPPLPKKRGDLGLTAEIALQSDAPALFQNLFSNGGLGSGKQARTKIENPPSFKGEIPGVS